MSRVNNRKNVFIESVITNAVPTRDVSNNIYKYSLTFNVIATETWYVIYKNSARILSAFKENQIIFSNSIAFYDTGNSNTKTLQSAQLKITSADYSSYNPSKVITITADVIVSPAFIPVDGSNNITFVFGDPPIGTNSNTIIFPKIGANSLKSNNNSGSLTKSLKKTVRDDNSLMGTLPSTKITTGKILQDLNDPFDETNIIEFSSRDNVYASIGLPLKQTNIDNKFYISSVLTDDVPPNLVTDQATISVSNKSFRSAFDLDNSKVFSQPNKIDNLIKYTRKIDPDNLPHIVKQEYFQEEYTPFKEESFHFESDLTTDFYTDSVDSENGYTLSDQKQIKITLDFTDSFDLHLMNTQLSFVLPNASNNKNSFLDDANNLNKIIDLKYFNFLDVNHEDSNSDNHYSTAYSCHSMPTAYWNNSNNRWSYLDAADENYLGSKIPDTMTSVLPNNFIFESVNNELKLKTSDVNLKNYREFKNYFYNRPILTTPSYRREGLFKEKFYKSDYSFFNSEDILEERAWKDIESVNKSAISQISDTYGFPYQAKWQPNDSHLIDMSKYISKDFLLEKVVFKGKFTHKGEFPTRERQVHSGFNSYNALSFPQGSVLDYKISFNGTRYTGPWDEDGTNIVNIPPLNYYDPHAYDNPSINYKEDGENYASNSITFFILNEKKEKSYLKSKSETEEMQHFSFIFTDDLNVGIENISYLVKSRHDLDRLSGDYHEYIDFPSYSFKQSFILNIDNSDDKIRVKNYSFENNRLNSLDSFNEINKNVLAAGLASFNKSRFHFIDQHDSADGVNFIDNLYYKKLEREPVYVNGNIAYYRINYTDINVPENIFGKIKSESVNEFDENRSRELVSFSNLLITRTKNRNYLVYDNKTNSNYQSDNSGIMFDQNVLKTIDEHKILPLLSNNADVNLNVETPQEFVLKSLCKNVDNSNIAYLDESEYSLSSNFFNTGVESILDTDYNAKVKDTIVSIQYSIIPDGLVDATYSVSNANNKLLTFTSVNHGFNTGDYVYFTNDQIGYYGERIGIHEKAYQITRISSSAFTVDLANDPDYNAGIDSGINRSIKHSISAIDTSSASSELDNIFAIDQGTNNVASILGYTLPGGPLVSPQSITKIYINSKENKEDVKRIIPFIQISFSYKNNTSLYEDDYYTNTVPTNNLNISDFITYTDTTSDYNSNYNITNIDINLRFLNTHKDFSIIQSFLAFGKQTESDTSVVYRAPNALNELPNSLTWSQNADSWENLTLEQKSSAFSLLLYYALTSCNLISNGYKNPYYANLADHPLYGFLPDFMLQERLDTEKFFQPNIVISENNKTFNLVKTNHWFDNTEKVVQMQLKVISYKHYFELFNLGGSNETGSGFEHISNTNHDLSGVGFLFGELNSSITSSSFISFRNFTPIEDYGSFYKKSLLKYENKFVIPEGKTNGENSLNLDSNRVINKRRILDKPINKFKSQSGKYFHKGNVYNSTVYSNYLLKPEDNLVFGVTSNCNGQTMPTVFSLHDKLEITLIGRDYVDNNNEYKNNESKSIRKVILGDNYSEKHRAILNETNNSYFDNIWNKKSVVNSLKEFKEGKFVIDKKSSRKYGSYTGTISLFDEKIIKNNKALSVYRKDTVHPSLGKVYQSCLNLKAVKSRDINFNKSLKVIISENFSDIQGSVNVINKWHKTFHLNQFSTFFNQTENISFDDTTFSNIENDDNLKIEICYDTNSYIVAPKEDAIKNIIKNNEGKSYVSSITNAVDSFDRFTKSFKTFCLPSSSLNNYQNGIQIQNEENIFVFRDNTKSFIKHVLSNKNIVQKIDKNEKVKIDNLTSSLQYFDLNNVNNESPRNYATPGETQAVIDEYYRLIVSNNKNSDSIIEYTNNIKQEILSNASSEYSFSPQWHLVLEINTTSFKSLLNVSTLNDDISTYIGNTYHIFMFENLNDANPVEKYTKVIKASSGKITLAIPLYFWETGEIDLDYLNVQNNTKFARQVQKNHLFDSSGNGYENHWYAKLSDGTAIIDTKHVYHPFVNPAERSNLDSDYASNSNKAYPVTASLVSSSGPGTENLHDYNFGYLPYSVSFLRNMDSNSNTLPTYLDVVNNANTLLTDSADELTNKLVLDRSYYISLSSFKTSSESKTPVYLNKDSSLSNLNNSYKLLNHNRFLTHEKYFENNIDEVLLRRQNGLEVLDNNENLCLNEKIYRSKIYKKSGNSFKETSYYLIYKIHQMNINSNESVGTVDNPINRYNIVEILSTDSNYSLFELDRLSSNQTMLGFKNTDIIRIYEDSLLENKRYLGEKDDIPYFEIDLSSKTASFTNAPNGIVQILYSHTSIDSNTIDITNDINSLSNVFNIENKHDAYLDNTKIVKTGNLGAAIFNIDSGTEDTLYRKYERQEDAVLNFFYGFSRSKDNRYPIDKLDGFKYGVENGNKQALQYHYSNKSYGQFSDKILGSTNCALITQETSGALSTTYTINKTFVDENFIKIESSETQHTYNTDTHERSTYPFIENSSDALSQFYVQS